MPDDGSTLDQTKSIVIALQVGQFSVFFISCGADPSLLNFESAKDLGVAAEELLDTDRKRQQRMHG